LCLRGFLLNDQAEDLLHGDEYAAAARAGTDRRDFALVHQAAEFLRGNAQDLGGDAGAEARELLSVHGETSADAGVSNPWASLTVRGLVWGAVGQ
jgi:hypothetical protein